MTSTTIKATMGQQCCLQLSAHQQCCQAHSCHAHQAMFFIFSSSFFFLFLLFCSFSHILNVYCNRFCCCCCRCQPHLATLEKVWGEGGTEHSRVRQVLARSVLWPHYTAKLEQPSPLYSALLLRLRLRLGLCIQKLS